MIKKRKEKMELEKIRLNRELITQHEILKAQKKDFANAYRETLELYEKLIYFIKYLKGLCLIDC